MGGSLYLSSPGDVPGLTLSLDSENVTLVSGAVDKWSDLSGNAYHAQATAAANRPAYNAFQLNEHPVLTFNGSDDYLKCPRMTGKFANGYSFYIVARADDGRPVAHQSLFGAFDNVLRDSYFYCLVRYITTAGDLVLGVYENNVAYSKIINNFADGQTAWFIASVRVTPGATLVGAFNGVDAAAVDISGLTWANIASNANTETINIGARTITGVEGDLPYDGDMACLHIYNRPLNADENTRMINYLKARYALT
ncbi:MAG: hypothetical protein EHM79_00325 [Geobacter sp.]|nr:MAG: hypothetical protein EHM79_00325 [Geobacter sp.]